MAMQTLLQKVMLLAASSGSLHDWIMGILPTETNQEHRDAIARLVKAFEAKLQGGGDAAAMLDEMQTIMGHKPPALALFELLPDSTEADRRVAAGIIHTIGTNVKVDDLQTMERLFVQFTALEKRSTFGCIHTC